MGYYMGDYYGNSYRYLGPGRGDPGIGSFLGGLARKAISFIPGVGPAASTAIEAISSSKAASKAASVAKAASGMVIKHPVISAAGAAGVVGIAGGLAAEKAITVMGGGGACPRGHHISKSKHAKHFGQCVKNRRMNVCNSRALRRAIRRTHGFAKLAMKTIHITHPKKKGRFGGFKRRRKH